MSTEIRSRQLPRVPVGRQFAAETRAEPAVKLSYKENLQSSADEVAGRPTYDAAVKGAATAAAAYANVDEDGEIEMEDA